jgi:hypothetical protein
MRRGFMGTGGWITPPRSRSGRAARAAVIGVVLAIVAGSIGWLAAGGVFEAAGAPFGIGNGSAGGAGAGASPVVTPVPTPKPPIGGTELYGYLPYWEMTDAVAAYLPQVPVQTLALFSVSATGSGFVKQSDVGYKRITGPRGLGLIADAHSRGQRVELVFTSFGYTRNAGIFGDDPAAQTRRGRLAPALASLAADLGVDGINVDVEQWDSNVDGGYRGFIVDLGARLRSANSHATLTVATTSGYNGSDLARAALAGGADRVFLMGYDYHWAGSSAGASAPIVSRDSSHDLLASITNYVNAGIPRTKILLGLPLYGMSWPVAGPDRAAPVVGRGTTWIPSAHTDVLLAPGFAPMLDDQEVTDYFVVPSATGWVATYYDSPRTLQPKLELARSQGLAGAGFWALGYEKDLPGYESLMSDFVAGRIGG